MIIVPPSPHRPVRIRAATIAAHHRDDRSEVTAGAVTGDGDSVPIDAQLPGFPIRPFRCGITVFGCGGKLGFGCKAVVDRDNDAVGSSCKFTAGRVIRARRSMFVAPSKSSSRVNPKFRKLGPQDLARASNTTPVPR